MYIEQAPNIHRTLENELPFCVPRLRPHLPVRIHAKVSSCLLVDCWLNGSKMQIQELLFKPPRAMQTHPTQGRCLLALGLVETSTMTKTPYHDYKEYGRTFGHIFA
jgi:hypothetical protein